MKKNGTDFEKYLYQKLYAYKTVPDDGNRIIELSVSFKISDEAFIRLDIKTLKHMVINQLNLMRIDLIHQVEKSIKLVENFK